MSNWNEHLNIISTLHILQHLSLALLFYLHKRVPHHIYAKGIALLSSCISESWVSWVIPSMKVFCMGTEQKEFFLLRKFDCYVSCMEHVKAVTSVKYFVPSKELFEYLFHSMHRTKMLGREITPPQYSYFPL